MISILGRLLELPGWSKVPAEAYGGTDSVSMVDLFYGSLILYAISGSFYVYALVLGPSLARPRRLLVRFISIKIVIILVFVQGYFTP